MKRKLLLLLLAIGTLQSCKDENSNLSDGLYAKIETSKGEIIVSLDYENAPVTVANFISLAEGDNHFVTNENLKNKPFYDGLKFHRVIANFMIQTGDPLGNGSGDTGYKFKDEFTDKRFDTAGVLAMANSGPNTNSCQFFITNEPTPWLDQKHSIFGHVIENGMEVVNKIQQEDILKKVIIIRKGEAAKKFEAAKIFNEYYSVEAKKQKEEIAQKMQNAKAYSEQFKAVIDQKVAYFESIKPKAIKTASGLAYIVTSKGNGKKPAVGSTISIHYAGFLENGFLFDTSIAGVAKTFGTLNQQRADANAYTPIPFKAGQKDGMIPGFIEGIEQLNLGDKAVLFIPSHLAYGAGGAGEVIPPNANIIFEIELVN